MEPKNWSGYQTRRMVWGRYATELGEDEGVGGIKGAEGARGLALLRFWLADPFFFFFHNSKKKVVLIKDKLKQRHGL